MGKVKVKDMDKITSKVENTQNIMVEGIDINAMTAAGVEESLKYKDFTINLLGE
ncbi:hypothetical protein IJM86_01125 [bacterium]|nr:hypothetical protein [bacterium]